MPSAKKWSPFPGVKTFLLRLPVVSPENRNRLLIHGHGGGYLYNPGEAGAMEAVSMAAYGGIKIVSVDYRMPPDHPYPAGLDDCMKVWKATVETNDPKTLGLFGSSADAGMALAMILRAKDEGLPTSTSFHPQFLQPAHATCF